MVDLADEQNRDTLVPESVGHQRVVRPVDERLVAAAALTESVDLRLERVGPVLRAADVVLEALALGVTQSVRRKCDADEDPDQKSDEDSGKRGDVVAEIEHRRLEPRGSLAQGMEPSQRAPGERTAEAVQPRRLEFQGRNRAIVSPRFEPELRIDVVARERPREQLRSSHAGDEKHPARSRAPKERRPVRSVDLPACSLGETAPSGTNTGQARPPVGEVMRLGDERPDVVARREQLTRS